MHALESADFRRQVGALVTEVERDTAAELVVAVVPRASSYLDRPLLVGLGALVLVFTALVFTEVEVGDYTLFASPLLACGLAFLLARTLPGLTRLLAGKRRMRRELELLARATFQKAGLHRTRDATAVFVLLARQERGCVVVADLGAARVLDASEWEAQEGALARALLAPSPERAVLQALRELGKLLGQRLPPRPDDVDELPSHVTVTF